MYASLTNFCGYIMCGLFCNKTHCLNVVYGISTVAKQLFFCRQLMVMDETYVINQLKEDVCYVSTQFNTDMLTSRSVPSPLLYVLKSKFKLDLFYNI